MLRAAVNQNTIIYNPVAIEGVLAQCIQNKIHNIESRIEELDIYYDQLYLSGDRYQQHYEESYDIQYKSMKEANDVKISQTDELMKTLESWKNHLDFAVEKNSYSINPIYDFIQIYFNKNNNNILINVNEYQEWKLNYQKKFVLKIENWFLECKGNPKYAYCRKVVNTMYDEDYPEYR